MLNPYFQQRNSIPEDTNIFWNTQGYSGMGLDVTGTFTAGNFTLEGSNDGATWTACEVSKGGVLVTTVSSTGHYLVNILSFNVVRLTPSVSPALNADLTLTALGTVQVPVLEST